MDSIDVWPDESGWVDGEWCAPARAGRRAGDAAVPETCLPGNDFLGAKLAYTIPEAGKLLGLCRASIYNLIADGQIATVNLSRRAPRILREELLAFLQRKAVAARAVEESARMAMGGRARR